MHSKITCQCGAKYRFSEEWAGKQVDCTTCGQAIHVPAAKAPPEEIVYSAPPQPQYVAARQPPTVASRNSAANLPRALIAAVVISFGGVVAAGGGIYLMNGQLSDLKQRAVVADELRTKLEGRLNSERERITKLKENADKARETQDEIRTRLAVADTRVTSLKDRIRKQQAALDDTIAEAKAGFKETAADLEDEIEVLKTELTVNSENTDQLTQDLNAANLVLVNAQKELNAAAQAADNLQAQIDALPPAGDTFIDDSYIDKRTIVEVSTFPTSSVAQLDPLKKMILIPSDRCNHISLIPPGDSLLTVLDTSQGTLTFHSYPNVSTPTFTAFGVTKFPVPADSAGRYDFKHTEHSAGANKGKIFDFVVLDTFTGKVWHSTGNLPGWSPINCPYAIAAVDSRFRLDVSPESESFTVTNIGPSMGPSNSWVNIVVGANRATAMTAVP